MYNNSEHYYECDLGESNKCTCDELIEDAESHEYNVQEAEITGN